MLDANSVSALFEGTYLLGLVLDSDERHHLPVVVIGEYRYGLLFSRYRRHLTLLLESLVRESQALPVSEETAIEYSRTQQGLREAGSPITENAIWIAALAKQYDLPVVGQDPHFDKLQGIRRIGW